jgi:uncharacterized protein YjhX (UPF0386 family)
MNITATQQKALDLLKQGNQMVLTAPGTWYNNTLKCEIRDSRNVETVGKLRFDLFEKLEQAGMVKYVRTDVVSGDMFYTLA